MHDLSYPRFNLLSLHTFIMSYLPLLAGSLTGIIESTWVFYPPLSVMLKGNSLELTVLSLHVNGISSLLGSFNYICTFLHTGLILGEIYLYSLLTASVLLIIGLPSVIACLTMVLSDRNMGTYFFNSYEGGNLIVYMHLF